MIDWLIASAVIFTVCELCKMPIWFSIFVIILFTVGWYIIGDD
jgi:hypothetical protein